MTDHAAIAGDYTDLRFVKGRKVCQVVVELPIEQAEAFVKMFGTPRPDSSVPIALARLDPQRRQAKPDQPYKAPDKSHKHAREAGILCNEERFRVFLEERHFGECVMPDGQHDVAATVRAICGVDSRAQLDKIREAAVTWERLHSEYVGWLKI